MCRDRLATVDDVRAHLFASRDDLRHCVIGFSGGKDSVALANLVHEINSDVPLVYAGCPGCEWPAHEAFVRARGAAVLDTGHGWDWFASNLWAFLYTDSRSAERWFQRHHRGHLRRYALSAGKVLLWGNRTADGNTVPAVRYTPARAPELWMPLRDLPDADTWSAAGGPAGRSPIYDLGTAGGTGYITGRLRHGSPAERYEEVKSHVGAEAFLRFHALFRSKFGAAD